MEHSWSTEASHLGSEGTERRRRHSRTVPLPDDHRSSSMMAHLSPLEIEERIVQDSELRENITAVLLYLRLDIWLLESIYALRNSGSGELAQLHPTLFTSPPETLFNLIYTLRHFLGLDLAGTIARLESLASASKATGESKEINKSKLAPPGLAYGCPSKNCKKYFIKSGHAVNHVEKLHPEYLKLHPDYQPSQFMVPRPRSRPASPELERQDRHRAASRQHELAPGALSARTVGTVTEGLSVYFNDGTRSLDHPSPSFQGYDSQGDSDEAPRLVPSRGISRTTSQTSSFHPVTPREQYGQSCPIQSRHPVMSGHSKRGRDSASSLESMITTDHLEEAGATRHGRHAKRRSIIDCY